MIRCLWFASPRDEKAASCRFLAFMVPIVLIVDLNHLNENLLLSMSHSSREDLPALSCCCQPPVA